MKEYIPAEIEVLVPVVRCGECVWWESIPCSTLAPQYHECKFHRCSMREEEFCSRGERRSDATD